MDDGSASSSTLPKQQYQCYIGYYNTKLVLHNFTLYNVKIKEGCCYVWNETVGNLNAEVFSYLQYCHLKSYLVVHNGIETIIIWSDG